MNWFAQGLIVLVLLAGAAFGWLRLDPQAAGMARQAGVPDAVVAVLSGQPEGGQSAAQGGGPGSGQGGGMGFGGRGGGALVITETVGSAAINDRVTAIGDGEALRSVSIVPLSAGTIEAVLVEAGNQVEAGAVLFRLDARSEEIARDRAELAVRIARDTVERYRRLVESRTVTAVQLTEAENELANAELALRDSQLELDRRAVTAPFAGIAGIVPIETGDYVTTQSVLATLDDRSAILLDFYVPERFSAMITEGQKIDAESIALPGKVISGEVTAIASRIDRESRTFQVRAKLDNAEDMLRPGMSFRVQLSFTGETLPAVPPLAIQWSSDGAFVWKAIEGKASRTPVRIIQRNSDHVLVSGDLVPGDLVVTEGLQNLRPGMPLREAEDGASPTAASIPAAKG